MAFFVDTSFFFLFIKSHFFYICLCLPRIHICFPNSLVYKKIPITLCIFLYMLLKFLVLLAVIINVSCCPRLEKYSYRQLYIENRQFLSAFSVYYQ